MAFEGREFPAGTPDFPFRSQVLEYLNGYAQSVRHLIVFNKKVERVEKQNGKWVLRIRDMREIDGEVAVESFDAVAVASGISFLLKFVDSGHYDVPYIPFYPGIDQFPAPKLTHSKYFRHASDFEGKRVLLIGNGSSGTDLGNQLVTNASAVFRSIRSKAPTVQYTDPRVRDVAPVKKFDGTAVELVDGTIFEKIDATIFCTGYLYSFPMFSKKQGFISEDGSYVHHLFQQTFYAEDPSLVFLGMPRQILPFPTFQNQAILVAKVWSGKLSLPTITKMRDDELERLEKKAFDGSKYHSYPFPEDVELAEGWRCWIEQDKSDGWEKAMKPWRWTEERIKLRSNIKELKERFTEERRAGKWDYLE
jgi:cation diffusion facilitator CzcD-associated flavoprotein CzcO